MVGTGRRMAQKRRVHFRARTPSFSRTQGIKEGRMRGGWRKEEVESSRVCLGGFLRWCIKARGGAAARTSLARGNSNATTAGRARKTRDKGVVLSEWYVR